MLYFIILYHIIFLLDSIYYIYYIFIIFTYYPSVPAGYESLCNQGALIVLIALIA